MPLQYQAPHSGKHGRRFSTQTRIQIIGLPLRHRQTGPRWSRQRVADRLSFPQIQAPIGSKPPRRTPSGITSPVRLMALNWSPLWVAFSGADSSTFQQIRGRLGLLPRHRQLRGRRLPVLPMEQRLWQQVSTVLFSLRQMEAHPGRQDPSLSAVEGTGLQLPVLPTA